MPDGLHLHLRLREARKARGLTQVELAERIGTVQHVISVWETGARVPSAANLVGLCRALEVSADRILGLV